MARGKHIWEIVEQGAAMFLQCETCGAIVAVGWERIAAGGYAFMFGIPRPHDRVLVSRADFEEIGAWFAELVDQRVAVNVDMRPGRRRRKRAA